MNNLKKIAGMIQPVAKYYISQEKCSKSRKIKNAMNFAKHTYANPNETLIEHIWQKDTRTVALLLDSGLADIDFKDKFGRTPLMTAAFHKDYEMVTLLVAKGADLTVRSTSGLSALDMALLHGDLRTTQFLVENGAERNGVTDALQQLNFYLKPLEGRSSNKQQLFGVS